MPTYDYLCDACGHQFEQFQGITEASLRKCPECGKRKLRRLFGTGAAIVFKGSGFYKTDYRSEAYKKSAEKDRKPQEKASTEKPSSETSLPKGSDSKGSSKKAESVD